MIAQTRGIMNGATIVCEWQRFVGRMIGVHIITIEPMKLPLAGYVMLSKWTDLEGSGGLIETAVFISTHFPRHKEAGRTVELESSLYKEPSFTESKWRFCVNRFPISYFFSWWCAFPDFLDVTVRLLPFPSSIRYALPLNTSISLIVFFFFTTSSEICDRHFFMNRATNLASVPINFIRVANSGSKWSVRMTSYHRLFISFIGRRTVEVINNRPVLQKLFVCFTCQIKDVCLFKDC